VAIGEVSALPAFATVSVVLVSFYHLNPVAAVLIAMAQGMVGFALLLDGAAWLFRKRIGLPAPAASDTSHG
jgi:H+/gluconate symporter-like permease